MAYRSLPRPSSPRGAKASIVRPYTLGKKLLASRYVAILFDSRLAFQGSKNGAGVVGLTGVEPVTSSLSGTRSNQLSYKPRGLGGGSRIRTGDILLAKQALYQLSHAPRGGDAPGPVGREAGHGSGGGMRAARAAPQLRDPSVPAPQKGGDPTAGSPTVTLLRLHPNHHPHLRPTNAGLRVQTAFMM